MKRRFRLSKSNDFKRVRSHGKTHLNPLFVLILHRGSTQDCRFAVVSSRSIGNAVRRNRAKRVLRAGLSRFLDQIQPGWEGILIARKPLFAAKFEDLLASMGAVLKHAGIINGADDR